MSIDEPWAKIFEDYKLYDHDFDAAPYYITAQQIKSSTRGFSATGQREVRILCKHDSREKRPAVFQDLSLFILPVRNGKYAIIKGDGYVDIPDIGDTTEIYKSKLDFALDTSRPGSSEMQHVDFAYASSLLRTFLSDPTLVLTIRGRKRTPVFTFNVGAFVIDVESVQTEVDAGYEGRTNVVLLEAKNSSVRNTIIRQLYYPYRQWRTYTEKKVVTVFFEQKNGVYSIWQFAFSDVEDYHSIFLVKSGRFQIKE